MEKSKKIVLFDGVCNLCSASVKFIIDRDTSDVFRFVALQSDAGKLLLVQRGMDPAFLDGIVLIVPDVAYYLKSDAALEIGKELKGLQLVSKMLLWLPGGLRNMVYDWIAKNRYAWYGKTEACMVPTPELKAKFLP